jgi:hypothetical protein
LRRGGADDVDSLSITLRWVNVAGGVRKIDPPNQSCIPLCESLKRSPGYLRRRGGVPVWINVYVEVTTVGPRVGVASVYDRQLVAATVAG